MNEEFRLKRFNKLFPWFAGLSSDLLFWVAIDTLFLTFVKGFTAAQIVSLTSISLIIGILLQMPLLSIIKKIGNTKSVRIGSLLFLISSVLLTFGPNYITIVIGRTLYEIAVTFLNIVNVVLRNNLVLQNREDEYIKFRTNANTVYAVITMVISFIASIMFNINRYLPMMGCITFCFICLILSINMVDYSDKNYVNEVSEKKRKKLKGIKYSKIVVFVVISYGLFYSIVNSGQSNGKLFIQQELLKSFDVDKTALIIGVILCASRVVRVISNIVFDKIQKKYKDAVGIGFPIFLALSLCLIVSGGLVNNSIILKILIMSFGYVIILFLRDPFKVYIEDLILKKSEEGQQQSLLTILELSKKIVSAIISLSFAVILINNPMIIVILILIFLSFVEIFISFYLYAMVKGVVS